MKISNPTKPKLGILALTLELYETLSPGVREYREKWLRDVVVKKLGQYVDVEFRNAVFTRRDMDSEVDRLEQAGIDAICVVFLTYAPSQLVLPALKNAKRPIIVWNIQDLFGVDAHYDDQALIANHGVHGTQDLANVLVRCEVDFEYVTTHIDDPDSCKEVTDFCFAASAKRKIAASRFGILGKEFPGMGDFAFDATQWIAKFGCEWTILPIEKYITYAEQADESRAAELAREYQSLYATAPDVGMPDLIHAARAELSLRSLMEEYRLDGFTFLFTALGDDSRTSTVPFVGTSRLMAEGFGFGGEGDLISVMATRMLHHLCPPVTFSEIFTTDYRGNALFFSHMGEMNVAMARRDRKVSLVARPGPITRTLNRQLALVTSLEPGHATLAALVQTAKRWKIITASMEIEDFPPLASMCVPHFKARVSDVRHFLTRYAKEGGTHHNMVCFGDARPRLQCLAGLIDADYVDIT